MMGFVGMEKYLPIVCDNCVAIACRKYRIHQRDQTHVKRYSPSFRRARHRDFNLIPSGVFRNDGLQRKFMTAQTVETFLSYVFEIRSTGNVDVLRVVALDAPLGLLH